MPGAATNGSPTAPRAPELLRFATAGSVDDGKSTLIGRLLFETKQILEDQYAAVEKTSFERGDEYVNLALLTDGLRAEREQGITIDVAYRYFETPRRKFIIADTPGHIQYTRNMVTGASTAALAVVLVDARNGIVEQSKRHAFISTLLRIPHLVVCVNKMDLVDYDEAVFEHIRDEFSSFAARLDISDLTFIPISALHGDNVVERSEKMPWFQGTPLLHHLENVHLASDRNLVDPRFPVQYVLDGGRDLAGQVASGVFSPGDEVMVLPSGHRSRVASVRTFDGELAHAFPPMSVTMRLEDEIELERGDVVCRPENAPPASTELEAMLCWMNERDLAPGASYTLKHTTRSVSAQVEHLSYRIDVNTLHRQTDAESLGLNDIGRARLRTSEPVFADEYRRSRTTGSFVLIDDETNETVAGGLVLHAA